MFNPSSGPTPVEGETPVATTRPAVEAAPAPERPAMRAGARLKLAREGRGLTVEQVAQKLMLRPDYVAALETMSVNLIPGKAYAKAYLRSYVRFLGLSEADVVAQYESESARLREDADAQIRNPDSKPARERPWWGALALALVGVGFIALRAFNDAKAPEVPAPVEAHAPKSVQAAPGRAVAPSASDASQVDPFALAAQVVEIEATAPGWLEVRGPDGTIFMSRTMQPGERYRPDVGAGWTIHAKDGASFLVKLNGAPVGALGEPGAPVLGRQVDKIAGAALGQS